jgi:hypothetical protein
VCDVTGFGEAASEGVLVRICVDSSCTACPDLNRQAEWQRQGMRAVSEFHLSLLYVPSANRRIFAMCAFMLPVCHKSPTWSARSVCLDPIYYKKQITTILYMEWGFKVK